MTKLEHVVQIYKPLDEIWEDLQPCKSAEDAVAHKEHCESFGTKAIYRAIWRRTIIHEEVIR